MDADSLSAEQTEFVRNGLYNLSQIRPDLDTLDKQLSYIKGHWSRGIGSINHERTLFRTEKDSSDLAMC
jgi:hypothetical protein